MLIKRNGQQEGLINLVKMEEQQELPKELTDQFKEKNKIYLSWSEFDEIIDSLVEQIKESGESFKGIYGIPKGGLIPAICLSHKLNLPLLPNLNEENTLIIDDISDTGKALEYFKHKYIATLFSTEWTKTTPNFYVEIKENENDWVVFPWE